MTNHNIEKEVEEFDERFRPIDFCNVGENKMTYVEYTRKDIKELIVRSLTSTINDTVLQMEEMVNEKRNEKCRCELLEYPHLHSDVTQKLDSLRSFLSTLKVKQ